MTEAELTALRLREYQEFFAALADGSIARRWAHIQPYVRRPALIVDNHGDTRS